jgi:hypothetical protein
MRVVVCADGIPRYKYVRCSLAQIRLEHGAQSGFPNETETGAWKVDMDHSTAICDGVESVNIVATVTGAPI